MAAVVQPGTSQCSGSDAVRPCDSVSRDGTPESQTTRSFGAVEPPAANVVDFGSIVDPEVAKLALQYASDYYSSYREYCRAAVGPSEEVVASDTSGSFVNLKAASPSSSRAGSAVSRLSGLSARSLRSASRASSWSGARVRYAYPNGLCYARLLRDGARDSVVRSLGSWPDVRSLFAQPAEAFLPLFATHKMVLAEGKDGGFHVTSGCEGLNLNTAFVRLARRSQHTYGTFGHLLSNAQIPSGTSPALDLVGLESKVGGNDVRAGRSLYGYGEPHLSTHRKVSVVSSPLIATLWAAQQSRESFSPVVGSSAYPCYVHEVDFSVPGLSSPARYGLVEVPRGSSASVRVGNVGDGQVLTVLVSPGVSVHLGQSCVVQKTERPVIFVCRSLHCVRFDARYDVLENSLPIMVSSCSQLLQKNYCYKLAQSV